jgi:hypothetical protein
MCYTYRRPPPLAERGERELSLQVTCVNVMSFDQDGSPFHLAGFARRARSHCRSLCTATTHPLHTRIPNIFGEYLYF